MVGHVACAAEGQLSAMQVSECLVNAEQNKACCLLLYKLPDKALSGASQQVSNQSQAHQRR